MRLAVLCRNRWTNFVNLGDMCGVSVFSGLLRPEAGVCVWQSEGARRAGCCFARGQRANCSSLQLCLRPPIQPACSPAMPAVYHALAEGGVLNGVNGSHDEAEVEQRRRQEHLAATGNPTPGEHAAAAADLGTWSAVVSLASNRQALPAHQMPFFLPHHAFAVLPFGISLLAPAWTDEYVAGLAAAYQQTTGLKAGPRGHGVKPYRSPAQ